MTGDRLEIAPMPRQPPRSQIRITPKDADRLVRLARDASRRVGVKAAYGEFQKLVKQNKAQQEVERRIGPITPQGVRLLRRAFEVFGDRLKPLLVQVGFAKAVLLAKLKNAKVIVKANKITLGDGTVAALNHITKRELEAHIRTSKLRRGHRADRDVGPGHVFDVPRDVVAVHRLLVASLKSLLPRQKGVPPRYKIGAAKKGERQLTNDEVLEHVKGLSAVVDAYRLLLQELSRSNSLGSPGVRAITAARGPGKKAAGRTAAQKDLGVTLILLARAEGVIGRTRGT